MANRLRLIVGAVVILLLLTLHLAALWALLHPHVSRDYKAYYIDRSRDDWHPKHYPSTPEQGIQLVKNGWPEFVDFSYGLSYLEPFGRWTDTDRGLNAGFQFNRSFSGTVCVVLHALPSEAMQGRNVVLAFGDQHRTLQLLPGEPRAYSSDFNLSTPASNLELRFPKHLPEASALDHRELGIALNEVQIFPGSCSNVGY